MISEALQKKFKEPDKQEDNEFLVDIGGLDIDRVLKSFSELKKQNGYLIDITRRLDKKDRNFEKNIEFISGISQTIKNIIERDFKDLEYLMKNAKQDSVTKKHLKQIATVNSPSKESIRHGELFIGMRKSLLDMAVKRASKSIIAEEKPEK